MGAEGGLRDGTANDILPERFVYDTFQLNSLLSLPVTYSHLIRTVTALHRTNQQSAGTATF